MKKLISIIYLFLSIIIMSNTKENVNNAINLYQITNDISLFNSNLIEIVKNNKEDLYINSAKLLLAINNVEDSDKSIKYLNEIINSKISSKEQKVQANYLAYQISLKNNKTNDILKYIDNLAKIDGSIENKSLQLVEHIISQKNFSKYYSDISKNESLENKEIIFYNVSILLLNRGYIDKAKVYQNILKNLKTKKSEEDAIYIDALINEKENKIDEALKKSLKLYELDSKNKNNLTLLVKLYSNKDDANNTIKYLEKLSNEYNNMNYEILDILEEIYKKQQDRVNELKILIYKNRIKVDFDEIIDIIILSKYTNNLKISEEYYKILNENISKEELDSIITMRAINLGYYNLAEEFANYLLFEKNQLSYYYLAIINYNKGNLEEAKRYLKDLENININLYNELSKIILQK